MKLITRSVAALAVTALSVGGATAIADSDNQSSRQAVDTKADYTPFDEFAPLPTSSTCPGEGSGRQAEPFVIPSGYQQQVVSEESDQLADSPPGPPGTEDLWDMITQNEFGKQAGRFLYRTHEVGPAASGAAPRDPGGAAVTVTDLRTGVTRTLAERNDWERFDGIVWTPWGTILAAEEVILASAPDLQVPQAVGGLVYELFVDEDEPWKLDPSREATARPTPIRTAFARVRRSGRSPTRACASTSVASSMESPSRGDRPSRTSRAGCSALFPIARATCRRASCPPSGRTTAGTARESGFRSTAMRCRSTPTRPPRPRM